MQSSGQPVPQSAPPPRPKSDFDLLLEYVTERFVKRDRELAELTRTARSLKLKGDVIELAFTAIDFRNELGGWVALARRLRDEAFADAMDTSHEERSDAASARDIKRPSAKLVESRAVAQVAAYNEVVERLSSRRDETVSILSWCQSLQRALRDEEYGDIMAAGMEVPEPLYQAPIGDALRHIRGR